MNKTERIKSAKLLLKKDSEYLERIKDIGTVQEILTTKTRIRIHQLTIEMNG